MNLSIKEITSQHEWNASLLQHEVANFRQSFEWAQFARSLGKKCLTLGLFSGTDIVGHCLVEVEPAKRGSYLAVAAGPLLNWDDSRLVEYFFTKLKQIAQQEGCWFIRFRPMMLANQIAPQLLKQIGAHPAPMHLTADLTLQLDLLQSPDEILAQMRKNTRSAIRKAQRLGITTSCSTDPGDIEDFYQTQLAVARRHGFVPFSREFLYNQFIAFSATNSVALIHSHHNNQLLASAFVIFFANEAVYHYGVSTEANAKLPGSYATQWRAILEAQSRGCHMYNFWGIAPKDVKDHRFSGVSLFKRGFGGQEVAYLPAHDIPVSHKYWLTYGFETVRRIKRGL